MKIIVTGGAGFIGSHIVDAYVKAGHKVAVIDNLSTGKREFINPKAKFIHSDIKNQKQIAQIIQFEKPQIINHHAAQISVRDSVRNPQNDVRINILGLLNIMDAVKTTGVKKIIFASSGGAIYGEAKKTPTPEDYQPIYPLSPYGVAKLSSECYLHSYLFNFKIPYIALRYSNVYGPRQNPYGEAGVVAIFTQKMIKNQTPIINGDGRQTRDYIFVEDIVQANLAALCTDIYGAYNIGTGIETSVIEIFRKISALVKYKTREKYGPQKRGEQKRSCLDIHKAKIILKWKPSVDLSIGLEKTVRSFQKHEKE